MRPWNDLRYTALAFALLVSACATEPLSEVRGATEERPAAAVAPETVPTTTAPAPTTTERSGPDLSGLAEAVAERGPDLSGIDFPTTTVAPSPPTTAIPVLPRASDPPRVRGPLGVPAAGGDRGNLALYTGRLANLGPDEVVAPAVVDPPIAAPGTFPLTGLPGAPSNRAALVVKVDNYTDARPQTGLNQADIVIEEGVEAGNTRFAAVYHSASATVGPVRSGRTTDLSFLGGFGRPILVYSGANDVVDSLLLRADHIQNRSAARNGGYWRFEGRSAPNNLYSHTDVQWTGTAASMPPAQFAYSAAPSVPGRADSTISLRFPRLAVDWNWTGSAWVRSQAGGEHLTAEGQRVSATNVVVVEVDQMPSGLKDGGGSAVPEFLWVGTGPATVYSGGVAVSGIWTRPTITSVATLTTEAGEVIELRPGRTWVEIVVAGQHR